MRSAEELTNSFTAENLAEGIEEKDLNTIGSKIVELVDEDIQSREEWEEQHDEWMKLAAQVMESKDFPWPNASNIKYPLLSTAALQFHARAYPALLNDGNLVKTQITGKRTQDKIDRSKRVEAHMSYQLLHEMKDWQEGMDRLLYILPITGLVYKKVYFDPDTKRNVSDVVLARDLIINYNATSFERATLTHRMYKDANEMYELQKGGFYRDIDLGEPGPKKHEGVVDDIVGLQETDRTEDAVYEIYECHTFYDLDGDGYKEPVIITVDSESEKVLRISLRSEPDAEEVKEDGTIIRISPTEYFVAYKFLPNPDSAIYALGFGSLLGPINKGVNTTLNQLIDAGTLSNLQGGFLAKGVRVRGGKLRFSPGEWKTVQTTGEDLRKGVFPMPTREPSAVLFNLLGMLVEAGERLSSVKDIMVGENPGQNQPYATTAAVLEQGMKVFVGIYKRIYRALGQEFKMLYRLNGIYLNELDYFDLVDYDPAVEEALGGTMGQVKIGLPDYRTKGLDIIPAADPNILTQAQAIMRANSLLQKVAAGLPLNITEVTRAVLEAEEHENIEALMTQTPPPPNPEYELEVAKQQHKQQMDMIEVRLRAAEIEAANMKDISQAIKNLASAENLENKTEIATADQVMKELMGKQDSVQKELSAIQQIAQMQLTGGSQQAPEQAPQGAPQLPPQEGELPV